MHPILLNKIHKITSLSAHILFFAFAMTSILRHILGFLLLGCILSGLYLTRPHDNAKPPIPADNIRAAASPETKIQYPPYPKAYINQAAVTDIFPVQPGPRPDKHKEDSVEPETLPVIKAAPSTPKPPIRAPKGVARIAIIIDDMGVDKRRSREVVKLRSPLTLAWLPYADNVDEQARKAMDRGHELFVHMPMQAMNPDLDLGPQGLETGLSIEEFTTRLEDNLKAFDGYVGVNNHMGSRLTQNRQAMRLVMDRLKEDDLIFIDSRTIATSVAAEEAEAAGLRYAVRHVFLDHDPSEKGLSYALSETERIARDYGAAIAIGHPKDTTIKALQAWLPTLEEKGFQLVPASALTKRAQHTQKDTETLPSILAQKYE